MIKKLAKNSTFSLKNYLCPPIRLRSAGAIAATSPDLVDEGIYTDRAERNNGILGFSYAQRRRHDRDIEIHRQLERSGRRWILAWLVQ